MTSLREDLVKKRSQELRELEEVKKNMEEVRKIPEPEGELIEEKKNELQSTMISSQEMKSGQEVVCVTEENLSRVSKDYRGLLRNSNGTFSVTP